MIELSKRIAGRVDALALDFGEHGVDPYGASKPHLVAFFAALEPLYRFYFRVRTRGIEHVPARGSAMLVGNHSGGIPLDAAMVIASLFLDGRPPRLAQGMVDKTFARHPFASMWTSRTGQLPGLPENAHRLLADGRLLLVFPEGAAGTAKLWWERHDLVEFGTGFVRTALATRTPIVPFAVLGGGDAVPTVANAYRLGAWLDLPYIPLTPYLLPVPLPVSTHMPVLVFREMVSQ